MDSKLLVSLIALIVGAGAGYWAGTRRKATAAPGVPDEERLAWLQRLSTVGQMMSGVVHEVRTPLNTVILTVEHAQRVLDLGGDPREHLSVVSREADRAVEILSDVLDFAKPSALDLKPLDLAQALKNALDPLKIRFDERGAETEIVCPPAITVLASARHFHQVITIILINALDALPFGGRLDIRAEASSAAAVVRISDTGVGIEPQRVSQLFEPFATSRSDSGGTGLGLNVARWIMNKHGGDVAIESGGIGKGTTVTLTLKMLDSRASH